jgi:hypothetical protein
MSTDNDLQFVPELRAVINRLIKKLRKESPTGLQLSVTERSTMAQLYQHKALQPSELAAMEMITNQSMSQVLNNLFELGYIIRIPSETDKRKVKRRNYAAAVQARTGRMAGEYDSKGLYRRRTNTFKTSYNTANKIG